MACCRGVGVPVPTQGYTMYSQGSAITMPVPVPPQQVGISSCVQTHPNKCFYYLNTNSSQQQSSLTPLSSYGGASYLKEVTIGYLSSKG